MGMTILKIFIKIQQCGHCKKLAPEYEKAATDLKGVAAIAKINADEEQNRPIGGQYGIRGFPTLKLFRLVLKTSRFNCLY